MSIPNEFWRVIDSNGNVVRQGFVDMDSAQWWILKSGQKYLGVERYQTGPVEFKYQGGSIMREQDGSIELTALVVDDDRWNAPPEELRVIKFLPQGVNEKEMCNYIDVHHLPLVVRRLRVKVVPQNNIFKTWVHNRKDKPDVWYSFNSKDAAVEKMNEMGGSFMIKEGFEFNPDWIKEAQKVHDEVY